jgi:hypothetical protein
MPSINVIVLIVDVKLELARDICCAIALGRKQERSIRDREGCDPAGIDHDQRDRPLAVPREALALNATWAGDALAT